MIEGMCMESLLRRYQISLVTLGTGVILFGAWSAAKTMLYFIVRPELNVDFGPEYDPRTVLLIEIVAFGFVGLILLGDLLLRLYVGRAARAEGMGRRRSSAYLYITGVMILFSVFSAGSSLYFSLTGAGDSQNLLDFAVSFVVDVTSIAIMTRLIVTARRVRRLRAELEG